MTDIRCGDKFGALTAIREIIGTGKRKWACLCDCGKESIAESTKLKTGHKKSCGCLRRTGAHLEKLTAAASVANKLQIIGQRFGMLTVLSEDADLRVTCACDCGNTVRVFRRSLVGGDTKSCGCLRSARAKMLADSRAKLQRIRAGLPADTPMLPHSLALRNLFRELSADVKRRDNFTCVLCMKRGVRLSVHHIERWSDRPDLRFDALNLVTLCQECHIEKAHGGNVHRKPDEAVALRLKEYIASIVGLQ